MGKHSASRAAAQTVLPSGAAQHPSPPTHARQDRAASRPIPAVLAQTVAFGALAVVVAVVALTWAGIGGREAAAVGIGLMVVGTVGFLVVRRTGLLERRPGEGSRPEDTGPLG